MASNQKESAPSKPNNRPKRASRVKLKIDRQALKKLKLVVVAYSHIERDWFPTEEAYEAEHEVEKRAAEVVAELDKLGVPAKGLPADSYFLTNLLVDRPDLVLNLVDTVRGRDALQTSVPAALELASIPYTGAGMRGMVIGNDRHLIKELLDANEIPTPDYQFISRRGTNVNPDLGLPLIVKLNESGGSVGIDDDAVKETLEEAEQRVDELIGTYHIPVIVERFVDGPEITAVVFDTGQRNQVFLAEKKFRKKPDGKYYFTSLESYRDARAYTYKMVDDQDLAKKTEQLVVRAFSVLHNRDYAKFDIRVDGQTGKPYFTDANPNTAFGPDKGLPFTEVLNLHGVEFQDVLANLVSKYAKKIA